jgi:hypothetical protein
VWNIGIPAAIAKQTFRWKPEEFPGVETPIPQLLYGDDTIAF